MFNPTGVPIPLVPWQPESGHDPAEVESRLMYDPNGTPFAVHGDPSCFRPALGICLEF
jgi:hypothetical protein